MQAREYVISPSVGRRFLCPHETKTGGPDGPPVLAGCLGGLFGDRTFVLFLAVFAGGALFHVGGEFLEGH